MRERYFVPQLIHDAGMLLSETWTNVAGKPYDDLLNAGDFYLSLALVIVRQWYSKASWHEAYDVLEYLLSRSPFKDERDDANAILSKEGSAYRFIGDVIAPITNADELAEVEAVLQHTGPFDAASQHIQAMTVATPMLDA